MPRTHINIEIDPNHNRSRLKDKNPLLKIYLVARRVRQKAFLIPPYPIKVKLEDFQKVEGKWIKGSDRNSKKLNHLLKELKIRLEEYILDNYSKNPSPKEVKEWYSKNVSPEGFFRSTESPLLSEYIKSFLKHYPKYQTKKDYQSISNKMEKYFPGLRIGEIDNQKMKDFLFDLKETEHLKATTLKAQFGKIQKIYSSWYLEKYPEDENGAKRPFRSLKFGIKEPTERNTLNEKQIEKLKNLELPIGSEKEYVRDVFLFLCYTSRYFKDLRNLSFEKNVTYQDGDLNKPIISGIRGKTGIRFINIMVNSHHLDIFTKYHPELKGPLFSAPILNLVDPNFKFNSLLKELGESIELDFKLTGRVARYTFRNLFAKSLSPQMVALAMGHSKINTQMEYNASNLDPYSQFIGLRED
ncbi:MAG: hypothetical protein NXH89_00650 [Cyclobacteriaceae bacterium]|nr:hypothetical protein [Cyclobacteriaceae bacterium]